jgi:hypothetical protein
LEEKFFEETEEGQLPQEQEQEQEAQEEELREKKVLEDP